MSLHELYHLNTKEIEQLYKMLAPRFQEDDLYCAVFPEASRRSFFLHHFFKYYVTMLETTCSFVANSPKCSAVMVVFDSSKEKKSHLFRLFWMNIKMFILLLRMHSLQEIHRLFDCWDMFTSRWVKEFVHGKYLHMDLLCTKQEMQGKGYAGSLIDALLDEGDKRNCDITMETHHKDNLQLYQGKGFTLMSTISRETYGLIQYNLRYRRK